MPEQSSICLAKEAQGYIVTIQMEGTIHCLECTAFIIYYSLQSFITYE